jgi:hypothetical protein
MASAMACELAKSSEISGNKHHRRIISYQRHRRYGVMAMTQRQHRTENGVISCQLMKASAAGSGEEGVGSESRRLALEDNENRKRHGRRNEEMAINREWRNGAEYEIS